MGPPVHRYKLRRKFFDIDVLREDLISTRRRWDRVVTDTTGTVGVDGRRMELGKRSPLKNRTGEVTVGRLRNEVWDRNSGGKRVTEQQVYIEPDTCRVPRSGVLG